MKAPRIHIRMRLILSILILCMGGFSILGYHYYLFTQYGLSLEKEFLESNQKAVGFLRQELASTKKARETLELQLLDEKYRVDTFAAQVKDIAGNVGTLVKLSKTDPQLLQKYSKVYFLNEHYIPPKLTPIDPKYTFDPKKEMLMHGGIEPFLKILLDVATSSNVDIRIISAYRSFGTQSELKSSYTVVYGAGTANKFSADQGYSEHQLGTTVDFTTAKLGANFSAFEKTQTFQWLAAEAYKYGFILSYPKNNAYYRFEPWHWRFVGRSLAEKLHNEGKFFYDLEQREIDKYLVSIFD